MQAPNLTGKRVGNVTVLGLKKAMLKMNARVAATEMRLQQALLIAGRELQADSQPLVPVDTGQLKRSADTRLVRAGGNPVVWVTYNTDYALLQHETLWFNHRVGQAKYLEEPSRTNRDRYVAIVKDVVLFGPHHTP